MLKPDMSCHITTTHPVCCVITSSWDVRVVRVVLIPSLMLSFVFSHLSPVPISASELSLTEVRDKVPPLRRLDPGLMPLPDTACGLEWSSLVNAAKAYEGEERGTSGLGVYSQESVTGS